MEPTTLAAIAGVASKIIAAGIKGWDAWDGRFDEKDKLALMALLDAGAAGLGLRKDATTEDAQFLGIILVAFGRAFENYWAGGKALSTGGVKRFFDSQERARQQAIETRLRVATLKPSGVGTRQPGLDELDILEGFTSGPLRNTYYQALWNAFSDKDLGEPLIPPEKGREFERHFLLSYWQAIESSSGINVRGYQAALQRHRTRVVQEMLLKDLASWGENHVFGNLRPEQYGGAEGIPFLPLDALFVEPLGQVEESSRTSPEPMLKLLRQKLKDWYHGPVIVKANFGLGKSLTARRIVRDLAQDFLTSPAAAAQLCYPIFIRCGDDISSGEVFDLRTTVQRAYKRQASSLGLSLRLDDTAFSLPDDKQPTLFVLDGLDEVALSGRQLDDLFLRLKDNTSNFWRFLVFSRPEALPKKKSSSDPVLRIEVLPFSTHTQDGAPSQVQRWLNGWNECARKPNTAIEVAEIEQRRLLELAKTPILLFMIAHSWEVAASHPSRLTNAGLYEIFFQQIAAGKAISDPDTHPTIFQSSELLRSRLIEEGILTDETGRASDAMLWLMSRVSWEAHRLEQRHPTKPLRRSNVEQLVEELGADSGTSSLILGGVLLAIQADFTDGNGEIAFGHKSFREFLIARYWSHQLKRLITTSAFERKALQIESTLLGGRIVAAEPMSMVFLTQLLGEDFSRFSPSSPASWTADEKGKLFRWAHECFNSENQHFSGQDTTLRSDSRASLREAALAIGSSLSSEKQRIRAEDPLTLRSMLARDWLLGAAPYIFASMADLRGANLERLALRAPVFSSADLGGASFRWSSMYQADLQGANLSGANLGDASLVEANLMGARLVGANLDGTYLPRAYLSKADLTDASLVNAVLPAADLNGSNLFRAKLVRANLTGTDIRNANLEQVILSSAQCENANFGGSNLLAASLQDADLRRCDFRRANLRKADLSFSDIRGANFDAADLAGTVLMGSKFNGSTLWPPGFDPYREGAIYPSDENDEEEESVDLSPMEE